MLRNSGSILLAAAVWPLLQGCAGEHSPASFGTVSLPLSRTTADGEYRFLGTIRVLDESGAAAGSVECDEGSPPTQTVSLLPGTYETQVVAGYSCAYAGSLEGFTGCSFAAATPAPFAIERNATTTVLLTFVFHFEQAEDVTVVFRRDGDAEFTLEPENETTISCGTGPGCNAGEICASLDGDAPTCFPLCEQSTDCANGDACVSVTEEDPAIVRGLCVAPSARTAAVAAGGRFTCALDEGGAVTCWGHNGYQETLVPEDLGVVTHISAGFNHTCAIDTAGGVTCWGYNDYGQCTVPESLERIVQVVGGAGHTCALDELGAVTCWSYIADQDPPTELGSIVQLSAGYYFTCAVDDAGVLSCWGRDQAGETQVPSSLRSVVQVAAGSYHVCALDVAGAVICWGGNWDGQTAVPASLGNVVQLSAGYGHTCALNDVGEVTCWGHNGYGQTAVPESLGPVVQVSANTDHTCALDIEGRLVCWGDNEFGQTNVP